MVQAYQADLVPASSRLEAEEIEGSVSIGGDDGTVRVTIEGVNDARGDPLESAKLSVQLKLRVNGQRQRVVLALPVEDGDGEVVGAIGLPRDARVIVSDVRVRGPNGRTLARAGLVTGSGAASPPTTIPPPPPPSDCPQVLQACQMDLEECAAELDACESGL